MASIETKLNEIHDMKSSRGGQGPKEILLYLAGDTGYRHDIVTRAGINLDEVLYLFITWERPMNSTLQEDIDKRAQCVTRLAVIVQDYTDAKSQIDQEMAQRHQLEETYRSNAKAALDQFDTIVSDFLANNGETIAKAFPLKIPEGNRSHPAVVDVLAREAARIMG